MGAAGWACLFGSNVGGTGAGLDGGLGLFQILLRRDHDFTGTRHFDIETLVGVDERERGAGDGVHERLFRVFQGQVVQADDAELAVAGGNEEKCRMDAIFLVDHQAVGAPLTVVQCSERLVEVSVTAVRSHGETADVHSAAVGEQEDRARDRGGGVAGGVILLLLQLLRARGLRVGGESGRAIQGKNASEGENEGVTEDGFHSGGIRLTAL